MDLVEQVIWRIRTNWSNGLHKDLDIVADIKKKKKNRKGQGKKQEGNKEG